MPGKVRRPRMIGSQFYQKTKFRECCIVIKMRNKYIFFEKNPKMKIDDRIMLAVMTFSFFYDVIFKVLLYLDIIEVNKNYVCFSNAIIFIIMVLYTILILIMSINRNVYNLDDFPRLINILFVIFICLSIIFLYFPKLENGKFEDFVYGRYDFDIYYSIEYLLLIVCMFGFLHYNILLLRVLIGIAHHKITGA